VNDAKIKVFPGALEHRFATSGPIKSAPIPLERLFADIQSIDVSRCQRLVIAGESPLEHPDFVTLIRECVRRGFRHIALETDAAALARRGMPTLLRRLGISQLVVFMGGIRAAAHDAVLRRPETLNEALQGLRQAVAAAADGGPSVYVAVPALRSNLDDIEPLLEWIISLRGKLEGFLLELPEIQQTPPEKRHLILPYSTKAQLAARIFQICQGHRIEYGFRKKRGILPCATEGALDRFGTVFHDRFQYFQRTPRLHQREQFVRVAACSTCSLNTTCNGVEKEYLEQFGDQEMKPVPIDVSMGWKLRRINRLEQFEYRNVSAFKNESPVNPRGLIRVNGHCNMSCAFCFVDRSVGDYDTDQLRGEIDRMAREGTRHLVLSGGEPTLHPDLPELIRHGRATGAFDVIEMQSNGVRCADFDYSRDLVEAGLTRATFSLHSVDPAHSDSITRLPRAFGKTMQAIHNFRKLGIVTQIAHVITKDNYKELPQTVRFLRKEFPAEGGELSLCLAIAQGISDLVFQWVIPTFTEIRPYVREALDYCLETNLGFGGMIGQGGYPPCMLDGDLRYYDRVLDKVFKSEDASDQFYKPERCRECSFDPYCLGPRRSYVEHYGDAEIRPFQADIPAPHSSTIESHDSSGKAALVEVAGSLTRTSPDTPAIARWIVSMK